MQYKTLVLLLWLFHRIVGPMVTEMMKRHLVSLSEPHNKKNLFGFIIKIDICARFYENRKIGKQNRLELTMVNVKE